MTSRRSSVEIRYSLRVPSPAPPHHSIPPDSGLAEYLGPVFHRPGDDALSASLDVVQDQLSEHLGRRQLPIPDDPLVERIQADDFPLFVGVVQHNFRLRQVGEALCHDCHWEGL